jgi:hypothetical protein
MKNISIFAKLAFLNIHPHVPHTGHRRGRLMRISSLIRCTQIAEHLGARINPESGYENDVCIYVKPGYMFNDHPGFNGDNVYIDVVDDRRSIYVLKDHPNFTGIACSKKDQAFLQACLKNKIIFIPQHHVNFERVSREIGEIRNVGMVGSVSLMPYFPEILKTELAKRRINLFNFTSMYSRQDVVNFYTTIDLQIVWRPYPKWLSNPLKIINAASFGIPTIALQEPGFQEIERFYFPVHNENEFVEALDGLIVDRVLREDCSLECIALAEDYHIDRIGELYKQLCLI